MEHDNSDPVKNRITNTLCNNQVSGFRILFKESSPGTLFEPTVDPILSFPWIPETIMVEFAGKDEYVNERSMKEEFLKYFQRCTP